MLEIVFLSLLASIRPVPARLAHFPVKLKNERTKNRGKTRKIYRCAFFRDMVHCSNPPWVKWKIFQNAIRGEPPIFVHQALFLVLGTWAMI